MKLATAERKTHWSDMDNGGYTALDFALHDNHVLNANVFMRPLGRVGIYRVSLYNLYSGAWVMDIPNIIIYVHFERATCLCGARSGSPQLWSLPPGMQKQLFCSHPLKQNPKCTCAAL